MYSSDLVSKRTIESTTGNEGFFDAIGNGIKKVWDYLMNLLKSIKELLVHNRMLNASRNLSSYLLRVVLRINTVSKKSN